MNDAANVSLTVSKTHLPNIHLVRFSLALLVLASFVLLLALSQLSHGSEKQSSLLQTQLTESTAANTREQWGVRVIGIRTSAAGYMLDFRYRVLDSEKAAPLLASGLKPYVISSQSGARLGVPNPPKVGSLRNSTEHVKAGRNYFVLFANPGKHVKKGDNVSVVIGDFRIDYLIVE